MAKVKIDFKKFKQIFTSRFEILALLIASALVALCLVWGVSTYLGASSPEPKILEDVNKLKALSAKAERLPPIPPINQLSGWPPVTDKEARLLTNGELFLSIGGGLGKRVSPTILGMDQDQFQMDYLIKGVCMYDVLGVQEKLNVFKGGGGETKTSLPVIVLGRERIVVVNGTFSYDEQIKLFQKALLMESAEEIFTRGMAPSFEGLIVDRRKISRKDGKEIPGDWEPLYSHDPATGKVVIHNDAIKTLLQQSVYDINEVDRYREVIHGMSVMPMPRLMGGDYPEIKLAGIAGAKNAPPPDPKAKKGAAPKPATERPHFGPQRPSVVIKPTAGEPDTETHPFADLQEHLRDQLTGKINYFGPYGTFAAEDIPLTANDPNPDPNQPTKATADGPLDKVNNKARPKPPLNPKALIRFIDVNVEPGNLYQYRVKLRFSNPNYNQIPKYVVSGGLTRIREIYSDWVVTHTIDIPANSEFRCYVTNQERNFVSRMPGPKAIDRNKFSQEIRDQYVPFQVHKFIDTYTMDNKKYFITDWAMAERLLVARGEQVGRECEVEVTHWNKKRMQWEVVPDPKKGGKALSLDFRSEPPVVLLDFTGGYQQYKTGKTTAIGEESGTEALMLMPDLTMTLKTTRDDMDEQFSDTAKLRREAFDLWKARLEDLRTGGKAADKGGGGIR